MVLKVNGMKEDDAIFLKQVFSIPEFKTKIISVPKLMEMGYYVGFGLHECTVKTPKKGIISVTNNREGLYFLHAQAQQLSNLIHNIALNALTTGKSEDINAAHQKMGHINKQQLRATYTSAGIKLTGKLQACNACMACKSKKKSIPKVTIS